MQITPKQQDIFSRLFERSGQCESIWIAGGAVVDLDKAGDIDFWFGGGRDVLAKKFLDTFEIRFPLEEKDISYMAGQLGTTKWDVIGSALDPFSGKIVQVLVVPQDNALDAMQSFDISTHKWAYTSLGDLVQGIFATEPTDPPHVLHWTSKTFERYVKICQRYGHPIDVEVLKQHVEMPKQKKSLKDDLDTLNAIAMKYCKDPLFNVSKDSFLLKYVK